MLHCSWDMVCDWCNYFSFWAIFCSFTPPTAQKIKIEKKKINKKKMKNHLMISSFYKSVPKIMNRWCTVPEIECMADLIAISHLDYFLSFYLPQIPKIKILKKGKIFLEILSFYICVPEIMIRWCTVPEMWCMTDKQMDGRTDGSVIRVGIPPKK